MMKTTKLPEPLNPTAMNKDLVLLNPKGESITTSLIVAEVFEKNHADVLRDIRNLSCSKEFSLSNFAESEYTNERGKTYPMYEMTKNGFSILVMGYTGAKAFEFKEKFIAEFDRREALLHNDDYIVLRGMEIMGNRIKSLEASNAEKSRQLALAQKQLEYQAPTLKYANEVLSSTSGHTATTIGAELNMSAIILNELLVKAHFIRKTGKKGEYSICAAHQGKGYVTVTTFKYEGRDGGSRSKIDLHYTEAGRMKIHEITKRAIVAGVLREVKGRYFINQAWVPVNT